MSNLRHAEWDRIGPVLAELEEEALSPPDAGMVAKAAAVGRSRPNVLQSLLEALQHPRRLSIIERDGEILIIPRSGDFIG